STRRQPPMHERQLVPRQFSIGSSYGRRLQRKHDEDALGRQITDLMGTAQNLTTPNPRVLFRQCNTVPGGRTY
ncbi:hypothetical protein, partial [Accumulibacter sp.]|uniref:hypothetical protein n=1 Tax=Accumulibacter sp. TaxID=2053492 RepID=UPI002C9F76C5